jgi:hypothetical protein
VAQKVEVICVTNRFRARISIVLMHIAPLISSLSASAGFAVLWLAFKVGEGEYRINDGALRPLSREVIEQHYFDPDGIDSEIWVPCKGGK